jgi:hypothetical protein
MKGIVWAPIHLQPRYAQLRGIEGDEVKGTVRLTSQKEEPLVLKIASVSIPDKVEVTIDEKEKGRTFLLTVKDKANVEARYRGKVTLTTNFPDKPEMVVPIAANVRGRLEVRPKSVTFGRIPYDRLEKLKASSRPMTRAITVSLNKGNDLKIEKIEMSGTLFTFSTREIQPGRVSRITVEPVLEKLKKGTNKDSIKIYTNQGNKQLIEIPIRFDLL